MYKSKFTLCDDIEEFEGYTDGSLWNGWASVLMTKKQARAFFGSTPYDFRFTGKGVHEKLIVYVDSSGSDVYDCTPIPGEKSGKFLRGFAIEGYEFMEVEE
jgi:hypothetical protein